MKKWLEKFAPFLICGMVAISSVQPCLAATITFDFSKVNWQNGSVTESFELYMANPRSNVVVGFNEATGPVTPAANYNAVENRLQINVDNSDRWGLLGIRADLSFSGNTADLRIQTVGALASSSSDYQAILNGFTSSFAFGTQPALGVEKFYPGTSGAGIYLFGAQLPQMVGLVSQVSTFNLTLANNVNLFGPIINLVPPPPDGGGGGGGGGGGFGFGAEENPEPASLIMMGTGMMVLGFLAHRRARKQAQL